MATTGNFMVSGGAWTLIASGRGEGEAVKVQGSGPFVLAITVGAKSALPELPPMTGHRVPSSIDIPLVAKQHLWASASSSTSLTVT